MSMSIFLTATNLMLSSSRGVQEEEATGYEEILLSMSESSL